ncbi:hypothetical protein GYMLUDRAFT_136137, partial [Collybiopsis luxurians FD-317 M1]
FCPAVHCSSVLKIFGKHFVQHLMLPERLVESGQWTSYWIRREAVYEKYTFCKQQGLREVWGYMWACWYCPKMWKLWARSSSSKILSRLRITMGAENYFKLLKHEHLHHLVHPRLDQLSYKLIYEVTPVYFAR